MASTKSLVNIHLESLGNLSKPWLGQVKLVKQHDFADRAQVLVFAKPTQVASVLTGHLHPWQLEKCLSGKSTVVFLDGSSGPMSVVCLWAHSEKELDLGGALASSPYALARDLVGNAGANLLAHSPDSVSVYFHDLDKEQQQGALNGLELVSYKFKSWVGGRKLPKLSLSRGRGSLSVGDVRSAAALGSAVNLSRHVVNIPADSLTPKSFAEFTEKLFASVAGVSVEVWDPKRLAKEQMGLLLGVGKGAATGAYMVRIKYRPRGAQKKKPVAFVGKGITFDTGGLNLKPAPGMRIMKKDMGGSGAVLGLAYWATQIGLNKNCDFYLALAENAVSGDAMRPSDILRSRSGKTIEIHNTDAEGRLAVADVLDVASTQVGKDEPEFVVDVCTLTGAIKYGLGSEIGGLFANDDNLGAKILEAGHRRGDLLWRMPLYQFMRGKMGASVADMTNSVDGYGGAITAALFLESFVNNKKWAHLDIYAWAERASGALAEAGASGQAVQALSYFLEKR